MEEEGRRWKRREDDGRSGRWMKQDEPPSTVFEREEPFMAKLNLPKWCASVNLAFQPLPRIRCPRKANLIASPATVAQLLQSLGQRGCR